jgi:acyl carrier protein
MEQTEQKIRAIAHQMSGINEAQIHRESRLKDDLGLDSLDLMELVVELETRFTITIPDDDALDFKKIQDVNQYVARTYTRELK